LEGVARLQQLQTALYIAGASEAVRSSFCCAAGWARMVAQPSQASLWKCCSCKKSGPYWPKPYCSLERGTDWILPLSCCFTVTG